MSAFPYRDGAKAYRGLGLGQAIPVTYGSEKKGPKPRLKGLIGYEAQSAGDLPRALERECRREFGDLNLGLHLADGVISLDVDEAEAFRRWLRAVLLELPATVFSTARGPESIRRQLLYRVEGEWASNGLLPAGGEIIDSGHRYVRAWPSIHRSGKKYHWYFSEGDDPFGPGRALDRPPSIDELTILPAEVADALMSFHTPRVRTGEKVDVEEWIAGLEGGEPDKALRRAVKAIPTDGADNNDAMALFGPLVRAAWEAPGGRTALEEGVRRYSDGYGPQARRDALRAVANAVRDERADRAAREMAYTFPIEELRQAAIPQPRERERKPKKKHKPKPDPTADPDYASAKVGAATFDALRVEYAATELGDRLAFIDGGSPRVRLAHRWHEASMADAREIVRVWHVGLARALPSREAPKVLTSGSVDSSLKLLTGMLSKPAADFDASPFLISCPNGVVDLRDGSLRPHSADDMFLKEAAVPYLPDARSAAWKAALRALDEPVRSWLQVRLGRALVGQPPPDDRALFLQGTGSNGKTSITDAVVAVLGDYAGPISPKVLTARDSDHSTEAMDLLGLRMAMLEELPGGKHLSGDHLKRVVGSRYIVARRMRQDTVTFPIMFSLVISTNHDITMVETDDGAWRRMWVVPFPYSYVADPIHPHERPVDLTIRETLRAGDPAVLAWLVEGARRALENPDAYMDVPEEVRLRSAAIRDENDTMTQFLVECADFDGAHWTSNVAIGQAYNAWMRHRGFSECNVNTALSRMRSSPLARGLEFGVQRRVEQGRLKGVMGARVSMPILRVTL